MTAQFTPIFLKRAKDAALGAEPCSPSYWRHWRHVATSLQTGITRLLQGVCVSVVISLGGYIADPQRAIAQPDDVCDDPGVVAPADTTRDLELSQFGITLTIPSNFRAILRNDGSVQIVDPGTYELISCIAQGGEALGRGYADTQVEAIETPDNLNLREFVERQINQSRSPDRCISPYPINGNQGYLVQSESDRHAEFWVTPPTVSEVVVISTSCDCDGMTDRLTTVIEHAELMSST